MENNNKPQGTVEITKAIIAVMTEVKGMEKRSKVGEGKHSYNGTKDQDVKEIFNDAMCKNGLAIVTTDIQEEAIVTRWEEHDSYSNQMKSKQSIFTKAKTKYKLLHISGESIDLMGYGHGIDTQDKGAGKATTYALKNALLYLFMTPVGKIDDSDTTHSQELAQPKPQQVPPKELKWLTLENPDGSITTEYMNVLKGIEHGRVIDIKQVEAVYKLRPEVKESVIKEINNKANAK